MFSNVFMEGNKVGTIEVSVKGLYYHFSCLCRFNDHRKHRILAKCGNQIISLGICVPCGQGYGFKTSIPMYRFPEKEMSFEAFIEEDLFYPVVSQSPFQYITKLRKGRFSVRDGQKGLLVTEKWSNQ